MMFEVKAMLAAVGKRAFALCEGPEGFTVHLI